LAAKGLLWLIIGVLIGLLLLPLLAVSVVALGVFTLVALPFTLPLGLLFIVIGVILIVLGIVAVLT
jgi:hypothetical protein